QNSLGKLYDEKYEDNQLAQHWEYYLKHEENHHLYPEFDSLEDLKIMDPACGSGHILLYAFDMLYDMYEEAGYPSREILQLILENNLYGLDIDKRAQQIDNFALIMKAAEKQPRFISRLSRKGINPKINVYEIVDADQSLSEEAIDYFVENETEKSRSEEHTSELQSRFDLVCRLLLEKKKKGKNQNSGPMSNESVNTSLQAARRIERIKDMSTNSDIGTATISDSHDRVEIEIRMDIMS